ncbi:MAG: type I-MYXAN CRISPR-associated endonuclease Cas1 [Acidobacteriota bacterium]|nr:type I-MYXAN CRISPR-associated endonuclease Cas1 [Acidobacteriota bacterium]
MPQPLRIMSLHALSYCERLFYLEEVENLRVADERVYSGRRLHVELERLEDEDEWLRLNLESERWGLMGKVDCVRRRDGMLIPYEHKRGRSAVSATGLPEAWASDRLQVIAYAALVEEHSGRKVTEGRVRYHASNVMVRVPIDDEALEELTKAIGRARELQDTVERPPVTENERLCVKCSLAPVCLPEEARLASLLSNPPRVELERPQLKLFPADDDRRTLHVITQGARVGRRGDRLEISAKDEPSQLHPVHEIGQVVLHGYAQISTQALRFCGQQEIGVHWVTTGGQYVGAWSSGTGSVQRRIRQYKALTDPALCLRLAAKLAEARARGQLSFLLRASREAGRNSAEVREAISSMRKLLSPLSRAASIGSLRGYEGSIGAHYFRALPQLIVAEADEEMKPDGRNRRPPKDRCNALLSFGYALALKDVTNAILVVGLDPALGFYHQPRSQAPPLALDLLELFRVPLVDLPVIASINRRQWDAEEDFAIAGEQVWLSDEGRRKFIRIYERRKADHWRHPVIRRSLSYSRLIELEVRLLEKEWMGEGGLFARMRLR